MIRKATAEDMDALTFLMGELGYPTTKKEMSRRFYNIEGSGWYNTLVAERDGKVVGMIGMMLGMHYEKNANYVRVVALIVENSYRKQGIGAQLLDAAEQWGLEHDAITLVLNSGNRNEREDAHRFYTNKGFEGKATGFYKSLVK
ncbi:GNAT family N-acetyltransferase [Oceanobacillus piezotolerans]|uniref:GNAT family N-acetyltransferase n=1 Tax=Oceanobacillus piezotolerans TaxID=2448030 RepID=A0A498D701_9BACI|nr:GNAT family N-acetyltransferase [Oceanobacillus piezotolerans]RLL45439.1 GNAT family N-acetyltransferase [Oceanobacillus piezotolerans]